MDVLIATDFFTAEVWTKAGLVTYYVLFFIHLASRKVHVAGVTPHPDERWMVQIARNVTMADWGVLSSGQYLIHDRDSKYAQPCSAFLTKQASRASHSRHGRPIWMPMQNVGYHPSKRKHSHV